MENIPRIERGEAREQPQSRPRRNSGRRRDDILDDALDGLAEDVIIEFDDTPTGRHDSVPEDFEYDAYDTYGTYDNSSYNPYSDNRQTRRERLARDEVAAVDTDRSYYVSDVPSPYLPEWQAFEDIAATKRRHTIIVAIVVIALVLAGIGGISGYLYSMMHPETDEVEIDHYRTANIYVGELLATIDTTALVRPIDERTIAPTVSGTIVEAYAKDGEDVTVGDILYVLDNPTISEAYNNATVALQEAQLTAGNKMRTYEEAAATVTALQAAAAAAPEDRATAAALASATVKLQPALIEANAANMTLQSMTDTYDRAREQFAALTIPAPISGTLSKVNYDITAGAPVSAGLKCCVISDLSRYCIDVEIPPSESGRITEGQEVRITFPDIPDLTVVTSVESIREEGSIRLARIGIPDPDPRIQLGMAADASIIVQAIPDSFIVPLDAITIGDDGFARLNVLLDASRGIKTEVVVNILGTNGTEAAISATNIQEGNAVILNSSLAEVEAAQAEREAAEQAEATNAAQQAKPTPTPTAPEPVPVSTQVATPVAQPVSNPVASPVATPVASPTNSSVARPVRNTREPSQTPTQKESKPSTETTQTQETTAPVGQGRTGDSTPSNAATPVTNTPETAPESAQKESAPAPEASQDSSAPVGQGRT